MVDEVEDVVGSPVGMVELVSTRRLHGWADSLNNGPAAIEVFVDDVLIISTTAGDYRPDVGNKGFRISFDPPISTDSNVVVKVKDHGVLPVLGGDGRVQQELPRKHVWHRLRTPLYMSPFVEEIATEEGWDPDRLALVREFAEKGVVKVKLQRNDFEEQRAGVISDLRPLYRGDTRVQDAWKDSESVRSLSTDPQIQRTLQDLYGREAIPMQTLNFWRGTEQPTHADTVHFNSDPPHFMCGVWIALEKVDGHNGQLHYYPGSNRLPIVDMHDIGVVAHGSLWHENYEYHQEVLHEIIKVKGLKKEVLEVEPGEAVIWAANVWHGGEPILNPDVTRHSQVTHYYFKGCSYYTPSLSTPPLGHYHRPDRRDIRSGEPILHMFDEIPLPHAASV
jgi:hypothetical protein